MAVNYRRDADAAADTVKTITTAGGTSNVFNLTVAKHFGPVQVTAGTYIFDNHNWLPQSANITIGKWARASGAMW